MSQSVTYQTISLAALSKPELPDESITRVAAVGWVIIAIFFGLFGTWAAIAPLKGAVVANESGLDVKSNYFLVTVVARQGDTRAQARALLERGKGAWPTVVWQTLE